MKTLHSIRQYRTLWALIVPHIAVPGPEDAARWCEYPSDAVEQAILRTARRFAPERVKPDFAPIAAYRYATAVARSIAGQSTAA